MKLGSRFSIERKSHIIECTQENQQQHMVDGLTLALQTPTDAHEPRVP